MGSLTLPSAGTHGLQSTTATITVIQDNGTPYRDDNGNPARDVTDRNGGFKIKTTVKGSYRVEIVPPRQNQKE